MMRVVVIDDEEIQRQGMVTMTNWQELDCVMVGQASDAAEALSLIRSVKPDIVITDVKMPLMTGLDMIALLQQEIDCEFIVISGYSEFSYAKKALDLGVRKYFANCKCKLDTPW